MTTVIDFNEAEVAEPLDFSNIGVYARAADQGIIGGAIAYPNNWARFSIGQPNSFTLTINPGLLFVDDVVYDSTSSINVNLQTYLPLVNGHQKWVLLLLQGQHEIANDSRMVETDADTGETVSQSVPKTDRLIVQPIVSDGIAAPVPARPDVPANECCLAYVLLSSTGIVTIEPGEKWRVKTLSEVDTRVTQLEGEITLIKQRTAQLETNFAWLAGQLRNIPRPEKIEQMSRNLAVLNRWVNLPDEARAYWYDPGLVMNDWDATSALWLARVREGIRFPYAQIVDSQMSLLNPGDTALRTVNDLVLPKWTEKVRIAVEGNDGSKDISQQAHVVVDVVQRTVSGVSISYGPTITICENVAEWSSIAGSHQGDTFNVNGVEYISDGYSKNTSVSAGQTSSPAQWNADPASEGHKAYDVRQIKYESWSKTYWDYITKTIGVNGSIYAQTFLNAQQMILTSIDLDFTRVGSDGDVHLFLCELNSSAEPDYKNVLASTVMTQADLKIGWNKFSFTPTMLDAGQRYAWFTVTVGNHAIAFVNNNKFAQGTMFWSTDGAWSQGSNTEDFAFRLNAAQFSSLRTTAYFNSLTCPLGMTEIQLLYNGWAPPGTSLTWEIKPAGLDTWQVLEPTPDVNDNPLMGLPALAQLRATFIGTTDMMPAIILNTTSRSVAMRPRTDAKVISKVWPLGLAATNFTLTTIVDAFDPAVNTFANRMVVGATVYTPAATSIVEDRDKPGRYTYISTFTIPSTTSARYHALMDTSNVLAQPFIQNALLTAL